MSFQVKRKLWVIAASLLCTILILVAVFVLILRTNNNSELTLNEAKQEVLKQYKGTIVSAELNGDSYVIRLKSQTGLYDLNVDKDHSGITAIESIELYSNDDLDEDSPSNVASPADSGNKPQPSPSNVPDDKPAPHPAVLLTEDEAVELALGKVDGTITDVDVEDEQGKWYYFVELETADGRKADIQINAASGVIVSVTWDDEDEDDDDSD